MERERDERVRREAMRDFKKVLGKSGIRDTAGVDEAGMAPWAGPVVAAAAMFPPDTDIAGLNDSKQLDAPTRERLAIEIRARASGASVGLASVEDIDRLNIYHYVLRSQLEAALTRAALDELEGALRRRRKSSPSRSARSSVGSSRGAESWSAEPPLRWSSGSRKLAEGFAKGTVWQIVYKRLISVWQPGLLSGSIGR